VNSQGWYGEFIKLKCPHPSFVVYTFKDVLHRVCFIFLKVYCSRYVKEHMVKHGKEAKHPVVLSYADLSVWCYECDDYLDNEVCMSF
jgi:hypothetical protein